MNEKHSERQPTSKEVREDAEWRALAERAGLGRPPKFCDESLAPTVDESLLRTLLRRELPEEEARAALLLVISFKSWYDAYRRVMLDEYQRNDE